MREALRASVARRRQPVEAGELRQLPAPASADVEQRLEARRVRAQTASRNDCAAAAGATGLKNTPEPSSPAATNRVTFGRAPRRHDLDVQPGMRPVPPVKGALVDPEHVRRLRIEEPVEAFQDVDQQAGQRIAARVVERRQVGHGVVRHEPDGVGVDGRLGYPGAPARRHRDEPVARLAELRAAEQRAPGQIGHEPERVDLAVRMRDRRADLRASVLEHQHVLDVGPGAEGGGALSPNIEDPARTVDAERPEGRVVPGRVEHDLAPVVRHRRPAIPEPADVVGLRRLEPAWAERAAGGREVWAILAGVDDERPHAGQPVGPQVGAGRGAHAAPANPRSPRTGAISTRPTCSPIAARASASRA